MTSFRLKLTAVAICVAALGWLALRRQEPQLPRAERNLTTASRDPAAPVAPPPASPPPLLSTDWPNSATAYFDPDLIDPETHGGTIHADNLIITQPHDPAIPGSAALVPPGELRSPPQAAPINAETAQAERELEELLDHELADCSPEERRVWQGVLQGLPIEQAGEILQIWKLTGGPSKRALTTSGADGADDLFPSPPRTTSADPRDAVAGADAPTPAESSSAGALDGGSGQPGSTQLPATPDADDSGRASTNGRRSELSADLVEVLLANIRHVDTPGYRRREPASGGPPALDLTPGALRTTGNPLHVAIDGPGFFVVDRAGQTALTRSGRFDLSPERELILPRADGPWRLTPPIIAPEGAVRLVISPQGEVSGELADGSTVAATGGPIELGVVVNPQHLRTIDGELLAATEASGSVHRSRPGTGGSGTLRQGTLELSNATLESETAALERLERRVELERRAERLLHGADDRVSALPSETVVR